MEINKENIEAYLLDYSEGNLTADQERELQLFVLLNPEYKEIFESVSGLPVLETEETISGLKTTLRKYSFVSTDEAFVKELEGELTNTEKEELQDMLQHFPELNKERERFALTVLRPVQIIYPNKEQLKRRQGLLITLYPHVLRIAALFLLTLLTATGIYYLLSRDENVNVVVVDEKVKSANDVKTDTQSVFQKQESTSTVLASSSLLKRSENPKRIKKQNQDRQNIRNSENELAALTSIPVITATIPVVTDHAAPVNVTIPSSKTDNLHASASVTDNAEYMDLSKLATRIISRISKGKVDFIHKKAGEVNYTELAVNTGDFEFVRKKLK